MRLHPLATSNQRSFRRQAESGIKKRKPHHMFLSVGGFITSYILVPNNKLIHRNHHPSQDGNHVWIIFSAWGIPTVHFWARLQTKDNRHAAWSNLGPQQLAGRSAGAASHQESFIFLAVKRIRGLSPERNMGRFGRCISSAFSVQQNHMNWPG